MIKRILILTIFIFILANVSGLGTPYNLVVNQPSETTLNISWNYNDPERAGVKVEIWISGNPEGPFDFTAAVYDAHLPSYGGPITYPGLSSSSTYYFKVRAANATGYSPFTSVAFGTTLDSLIIPSVPTNLIANASVFRNQTTLLFEDNSNTEKGFKIERALNIAGPFSEIARTGVNSAPIVVFDDKGLNSDTTYYYRVRAYNNGGNSSYSNIAQTKTLTNSAAYVARNKTLTFVFAYPQSGSPFPQKFLNFACNTSREGLIDRAQAFQERELRRFSNPLSYNRTVCYTPQIALPNNLFDNQGNVDRHAAKDYIRNNYPQIASSDYVITFFYNQNMTLEMQTYEMADGYVMISVSPWFGESAANAIDFYPSLITKYYGFMHGIEYYSYVVSHELMHTINATDKYKINGPGCGINPNTGLEYNKYDIMCAVSSYGNIPLSFLLITPDTSKEIGIVQPADGNRNYIIESSEITLYSTFFKRGFVWNNGALDGAHMTNAVTLYKIGNLGQYYYNSSVNCPGCFRPR